MMYGQTRIVRCTTAQDLGIRAAAAVAKVLKARLASQKRVRALFAAGESQTTFFAALIKEPGIDWQRVECFNVDDFWDPRLPDRFSCGYQTRTQLYERVNPGRVEQVKYNAPDADAEAARFERVLRDAGPIDILTQGIGTSGHLALDEPGQTDFNDPAWVRVVDVAETSKRQLREDPNFRDLGYIPEKGITMTVPALMLPPDRFTIVPLALKRPILTRLAATRTPTTDLPASILLNHAGDLFVDQDSCPQAWT